EDGGGVSELAQELPREDRRQGDLRDEPDRTASRFVRGRDRPQIHLGLPAAGHALEKTREAAPLDDRLADPRESGLLLGRQVEARRGGKRRRLARPPRLLERAQRPA